MAAKSAEFRERGSEVYLPVLDGTDVEARRIEPEAIAVSVDRGGASMCSAPV
jgi:hypothetical protein